MKLIFFLIGFFLIFLRIYLHSLWAGAGDNHSVTITISNGDDYEKIKYSGQITLTEDEAGIRSMTPGGYIQYRKNDIRLKAESDLQGNITYDIRNDDRPLTPESEGKPVIREAVGEMIAYGFDGKRRMMRIYERGGDSAVLSAMAKLKNGRLANEYRDFVRHHKQDSL